MNDRALLALSCLPYLVATGYACYSLGARRFGPSTFNLIAISAGFLLQCSALYLRGEQIGHCPVTNLYEVMTFFTWALALNYIVIGPVFRISLIGLFTGPLILMVNLLALLVPGIDEPHPLSVMGAALEMHISLCLLAYGTLGLSAMTALLYLILDHFLKVRANPALMIKFPPIGELEKVSRRVAILGFVLLTAGLAFGFMIPLKADDYVKIAWTSLVWVVYGSILLGRILSRLSPTRFAWATVGSFVFLLLTFWGVNSLSRLHQFNL